MITLSVVTFNSQTADGALSASFDELGGSIGRADTNHLVLPDPDRTISRVAAQVVYRNGSYAIIDRGSNPIMVNGQPVGSGREVPLRAGDQVRIGGYELAVGEAVAATRAATADPFADLLGPLSGAPSVAGGLFDPLAHAGTPAPSRPASAPPPAPLASSAPAGGIPDDWDPFAPDTPARGSRPGSPAAGSDRLGLDLGAAAPAPLIDGLGLPSADPGSLDELFGLGPGQAGGDPLARSVLDAPAALPNMGADSDPLRSLERAPRAVAASESDQVSDLNRPFVPPKAARQAAPQGAVMSWDSGGEVSHTVIRSPRTPSAAAPPPGMPHPSAMPPDAPVGPAPATAAPERSAAVSAVAQAPANGEASPRPPTPQDADARALLEALCRGLQTPNLQLHALTPGLMELVGQLLHEATAGTVDLLAARATFKRELRAQATTIVPRNNNPLKFSPSAEVALQHLLSPPARGFMGAAPAMRDAYNDLRAHQIGFVAGLQAALDGVLGRFDPAELEKRLTERSVLHSVLPASRKARMWEVFVEHYGRIRAEASDDFQTLFGAAFLKAYEDQIDKFHEEPKT